MSRRRPLPQQRGGILLDGILKVDKLVESPGGEAAVTRLFLVFGGLKGVLKPAEAVSEAAEAVHTVVALVKGL